MVQQLGSNTFSVAKWVVSPLSSNGTHVSITSALASASSGDTIWVRDGTYTENFTIPAGISLTAAPGDGITPTVTIVGKITMTAAGTSYISNVKLQTNSDFFLVISGSNSCSLSLDNCTLTCSNNTGISFTNSNAASNIYVKNCFCNLATTGIAMYSSSSAGFISFINSNLGNTGASTTASSNSAGIITFFISGVSCPLSTSSTGQISVVDSSIDTSPTNTTCITTAGTGSSFIRWSGLNGGTSSAVSIGAGTSVEITNTLIQSSNTNAITGAGTLTSNNITYVGTSHTQNVTTTTPKYSGQMYRASQQPAFRAALSTTPANVTGDGTAYTVIFDTKAGDQGSNYNNATGLFTCPVDGFYQFSTSVQISNLGAGHTSGYVQFTTTAGTSSYNVINVGAVRDSSNACCLQGTITLFLNATNTVAVQVIVSNSTKTVSVGAGTTSFNSFNGSLLC